MLRLELLKVKASLERGLEEFVLDCSDCGQTAHWVSGLGVSPDTGRTGSLRRTASLRCEPPLRGRQQVDPAGISMSSPVGSSADSGSRNALRSPFPWPIPRR
jgi:hypothetical protein